MKAITNMLLIIILLRCDDLLSGMGYVAFRVVVWGLVCVVGFDFYKEINKLIKN